MSTRVTKTIKDIAYQTFEVTCYMFPLDEWEIEESGNIERPDGTFRSIVQFDGAVKGGMVISPSESLLGAIAANMLGVEEASDDEKEGALCEIANIICGNTVPIFANNNEICYIRPPRMAKGDENTDEIFDGMKCDKAEVLLDEGIADITLFHS
ncbi:chemotaxis protein CheX [Gracilimonas sp. Q87]|uniref:chemotaxis protein CheX n=1 Tax=Gracilimonas sp. Q87 TaxID=3384766 RepID=UPI0039842A21